jgi:hypothetical protein
MTMRSRRETITFQHPFRIKGIDRLLPPGSYEVITDEEMIEGLSFASFRRVATMIMVPAAPPHSSTTEMISISSIALSDAQRIDASAPCD